MTSAERKEAALIANSFEIFLCDVRRQYLAAKGMSISAENLMEQLNGIRETACVYPQAKGQPAKPSSLISRLGCKQP